MHGSIRSHFCDRLSRGCRVRSSSSLPFREGRRIDVVLLVGSIVFVVEFKVGATSFDAAALDQVWDYALDLKNFHEASHARPIVPLLIATEAREAPPIRPHADPDGVYRPIAVTRATFREAIDVMLCRTSGELIDAER
jgi:hypothetical protein